MATEVILPRVDMDMAEGQIARWHAQEGDQVAEGDTIFEIETDKAAMEVDAPASGVLRGICAQAGDTVPIGQVVAWVCAPDERFEPPQPPAGDGGAGETDRAASAGSAETAGAPAPAHGDGAAATAETPSQQPASAAEPASAGGTDGGLRATPLARRLARQNGIDLAGVEGTGPRGRIHRADVERALEQPAAHARAPAQARAQGDTQAADGRLAVRTLREGNGDPLVLLHGFGAQLDGWRPLAGEVHLGQPVLALDLPGHGAARDVALAGFDGLVADVEDALRDHGLARLHLVGHSLGGAVAAELADGGALDVRSLTLLAPGGLGPEINGAFIEGFCQASEEAPLRAWLRELVYDPASLPDALVRASVKAHQDAAAREAHKRAAGALFPQGTQVFAIHDALARYPGPTRAIFGRDDRIVPARHADALPGHVAVHRLSGVGHMPHVEATALTGRLVQETLRSAG